MLMNSTRLFAGMQERRLDAIVATMPENVTYASGFWAMSQWIRRGPQAYVLTPALVLGEPVVIASSGLIDLAADSDAWVKDILRFGKFGTARAADTQLTAHANRIPERRAQDEDAHAAARRAQPRSARRR